METTLRAIVDSMEHNHKFPLPPLSPRSFNLSCLACRLTALLEEAEKVDLVKCIRSDIAELRTRVSEQIDTGDYVYHAPSGEKWVVAYVQGDRLSWCGWPEGEANLSDCTLIQKATPEIRHKLLEDMSQMGTKGARQRYAERILSQERPPAGGVKDGKGRGFEEGKMRAVIAVFLLFGFAACAQAQKVTPYVSEAVCIAANGESGPFGFDAKGDYHEMKCVEADGGWEYLDHVTPRPSFKFSGTSASGWLTISSSGSSVTTLSIAKNNDVICFVDKSGNVRLVHGKTWRQCAELLMKYVSGR